MTQTGHILSMAELIDRLRVPGRSGPTSTADRDAMQKAADEIERLRAQGATLREQHKQAHENSAKIFSALVDISVLTPLGGEVADYADVVAAVRALWDDAERYQWLRGEVHGPHIPMAQVVWKSRNIRDSGEWTNLADGPSLDAAIDAARKAG